MSPIKKHLDKIGVGGSLFAALCCLGFPALLAILSAVGLGFLVKDKILIPLLAIFLLVTLGGLILGVKHHGKWPALILGAVSAAATFIFIALAFSPVGAGIALAGLIASSLLNVWLARKTGQQNSEKRSAS